MLIGCWSLPLPDEAAWPRHRPLPAASPRHKGAAPLFLPVLCFAPRQQAIRDRATTPLGAHELAVGLAGNSSTIDCCLLRSLPLNKSMPAYSPRDSQPFALARSSLPRDPSRSHWVTMLAVVKTGSSRQSRPSASRSGRTYSGLAPWPRQSAPSAGKRRSGPLWRL